MHTAPFWAISASTVLVKLLPPQATWRRAVALTAATVLPWPALPPITTTHALIILAVQGRPMMANDPNKGEAYLPDCDQAVGWVERHTQPGEVVYTNKEWIGDLVPLLSDRRSDFGCWWECSRQIGNLQNRFYRDDGRRAVFLCIRPESDVGSILGPTRTMPPVDEQLDIGRFRAGIRYQRLFSPRRVLDDFEGRGPIAWCREPRDQRSEAHVVAESAGPGGSPPRRYLSWRISSGAADGARLARPIALDGAPGLAMNVRASAPLSNVRLGLTEMDGSQYEHELSLPCVAQPIAPQRIERALWVRIRVALDGMVLTKGQTDENGRLDPDQVTSLWLQAGRPGRQGLRVDLDDIELMNVEVVSDRESPP